MFDVRVLPNPYYVRELKALTGRDAAVAAYLEAQPEAIEMLAQIEAFLQRWLPAFEADQRSSLTVAIGCTGGQHRSVWFVERLAERFGGHLGVRAHTPSRDRGRPVSQGDAVMAELPLFPLRLGAVPGRPAASSMIFEARYLDLMSSCMRAGQAVRRRGPAQRRRDAGGRPAGAAACAWAPWPS